MRYALALVALLLACTAVAADPVGSPTVRVAGRVETPTTFTVDDLRRLAPHEVVLRTNDAAPRAYRGVLLRDLLVACRLVEAGRFDLRQSYVVAQATDGYLGVFSWAELFNSPIGDDVLVAYDVDGAALGTVEGPLAIVSARDLKSGPRHVRWLASIDVRRATP